MKLSIGHLKYPKVKFDTFCDLKSIPLSEIAFRNIAYFRLEEVNEMVRCPFLQPQREEQQCKFLGFGFELLLDTGLFA